MSEVNDIINHLRGIGGTLNRSEQRVLNTILADLEFASTATNRAIAQKARVSEPTLSRFCKTIGCRNFQDFKNKLVRNLAIGKQYFPENNPANKDFVISDVVSFAQDALQKTAYQLDAEAIRQATTCIAAADKLAIMGLGGQSSSLAGIAENRFFRLSIASRAYCDGYLQRMAAAVLNQNDALLAISSSGRARDVIDSVHIAKQYQVPTISITRRAAPLARATDISIELVLEEDDNNYKPSSSRYGFLAVIDMLAMGVAIAKGESSLEYLRRIRANLFPTHRRRTKNVIGD